MVASITIPESVTAISEEVFYGCRLLKDVYYGGSESQWKEIKTDGGNAPLLTATIHCADGSTPAPGLDADSVASGKCGSNLTWTLDADGKLTISGMGLMSDFKSDYTTSEINTTAPWAHLASRITSAEVKYGVANIGNYAFAYCDNLTGITIPDSVYSIGTHAMFKCGSLADVKIPNSVTSIGNHAFFNCSSLTALTIPDRVTSIEDYVFYGCSGLSGVVIPDRVTRIGIEAFSGCSNLSNVTVPSSVTSIEDYAFLRCTSLTDVYYGGSQSQWNQIEVAETYNGNAPLLNASIHYNSSGPAVQDPGVAGFSDVPSGAYYADAVEWAVDRGIVEGMGNGTFGSTSTVTRAQAVTLLWRAAGKPAPQSPESTFSDVTDTKIWYYDAVLWAAEEGITNGTGNGKFGVEGTLAYDQMLAFMCRAAGVDTSGDWSGKAVAWAASNGLTSGLSFSADKNCPRSDVVYILWKDMA